MLSLQRIVSIFCVALSSFFFPGSAVVVVVVPLLFVQLVVCCFVSVVRSLPGESMISIFSPWGQKVDNVDGFSQLYFNSS